MTKKEVMQKTIESIAKVGAQFNFKAEWKNQWLIRNEPDHIFMYELLIYDRTIIGTGAKGFQIEPMIWVNVKVIEAYYKQITVNTELKKDVDFKTIGSSIASLIANPDGIFRKKNESLNLLIFEENHIPGIAETLIKQFNKVALPYCLTNCKIPAIDKIANSHPDEWIVHMMNDYRRMIRGVIAAKLNGNPELDHLLNFYERKMIDSKAPEMNLEEMKRLKIALPSIGSN
ncbi:hypothetical protein [Chitinophaga sp. RAB17]|uniref:hypothetical protein n=1 Tax=Chitinophaga sp. RAB17 TaxID=3233049 RepID=UPI003F8E25F8